MSRELLGLLGLIGVWAWPGEARPGNVCWPPSTRAASVAGSAGPQLSPSVTCVQIVALEGRRAPTLLKEPA